MTTSTPSPRVTILTVAKEAGVSHSTVSIVLNRKSEKRRIPPETQKRVLEAARKLNYQPNHLARGLRGQGTRMVGVLWSLDGPHASEAMARRIALLVQQGGFVTTLVDNLGDPEITTRALGEMASRGVEAMIIQDNSGLLDAPQVLEQLTGFSAVVAVRAQTSQNFPVDVIHHDRAPAFAQAAEHFVQTGRKRPAILIGNSQMEKVFAFVQVIRDAGLPVDPYTHLTVSDLSNCIAPISPTKPQPLITRQQLSWGGDAPARGWQTLEDHFPPGTPVPFDALLCMTDDVAVAAQAWLRSRGLRVPDDVALAGFNNSAAAPYADPPLASIERHDSLVAESIGRMLFARLAEPDRECQSDYVPMSFVPRASAGLL